MTTSTATTATGSTTTALDLSGAWTALITPFRDGAIDEPALRALVEMQIAGGIDGLVACGSTGETPTLTPEEYTRVIAIVVDQAAGRVPVMAGTGTNDTASTLERTRIAERSGTSAALIVMPYYNRPTQEGLYQHIRHIAERSSLPIVLYNVPGRTAVNLLPETVLRLAEVPGIAGIKEASGSLDQTSQIVRDAPSGFALLSGNDSLTLPIMAAGGTGVVSVVANVAPGATARLTAACLAGDLSAARRIHLDLFDLCRAMFVETNPVPVKYAAGLLGLCADEVRLPLVPPAKTSRQRIAAALAACPLVEQRRALAA